MNTTFNLWLNNKPNKDGRINIFIRTTQNRKHKLVKSGVSIAKVSDFDPKGTRGNWIRGRSIEVKKANIRLKEKLAELETILEQLEKEEKNPSKERLLKKFEGDFQGNFLAYLKKILDRLDAGGKYRSFKRYNQLYNKLVEFEGSNTIPFDQLTVSYLKDFQSYLSNLHQNSIYEHFKNLKATFNAAIQEQIIAPEKNPFIFFKVFQTSTNREKLSEDELDRLKALELTEGSLLWHSRNYFFFSFFTGGIRAGDLIAMKWESIADGRLSYVMAKTRNSKLIKKQIPLIAEAEAILSHYRKDDSRADQFIFGLLKEEYSKLIDNENKIKSGHEKKVYNAIASRNTILNRDLKKLAALADITKPLTFHIARHSFADYAIKKGIPPRALQEILGHQKFETTERTYINSQNNQLVNDAMKNLFNK